MREQYEQFVARRAALLVICPESHEQVRAYWEQERLPFPGLADRDHAVADRFGQEVSLLRLGRMPTALIVDRDGRIRYAQHGAWMTDTAPVADLLAQLDSLAEEAAP